MARELSAEFKTAFGRMLIGLRMNYTVPNALNYSATLIEYTRGGLVVLDKIGKYSNYEHAKDYAIDFAQAEALYKDALSQLRMKGRNHVVEERIHATCFEINKRIFPIALKEGILVMNEEMFGVADMFLKGAGADQPPKRR